MVGTVPDCGDLRSPRGFNIYKSPSVAVRGSFLD